MPGGTWRYVQPAGRDTPPVKTTEEEGTTSHPFIKAQKEESNNQEENTVHPTGTKNLQMVEEDGKIRERNSNRLDTNRKPKRKSGKCTEWKLGTGNVMLSMQLKKKRK